MELVIDCTETHLRFRDLETAKGYLAWSTDHALKEYKPLQRFVTYDNAPSGAFKLVERTEWIGALFVICIINKSKMRVLKRDPKLDKPILSSIEECL